MRQKFDSIGFYFYFYILYFNFVNGRRNIMKKKVIKEKLFTEL